MPQPRQSKQSRKGSVKSIDNEIRRQMIAEAAYFRAQQRDFIGGDPVTDWLYAEAEIDQKLSSTKH